MFKISNYINGEQAPPVDGNYIDNISPTNGEVYSLIPDSSGEDVLLAISAAKKAFSSWGQSTKEFRCRWLMKLANAIDDRLKDLAEAESFDNGKPVWLAESMDIPRCSANIRFFASAILHFNTKAHEMDGSALNYTLKQPIGVAGCISPWNLPLYLLTWKIAPALAAGNTVVAKPSEVTPYTAYLFGKICQEIGFPRGVINIVHGYGSPVGEEIVENCDVISFTGGTKTGALIAERAAVSFKKYALEMGGKNPALVFNDSDFDLAIENCIRSAFLNQGQICLCGSRILIEESLYEKFKSVFVKRARELIVGSPKDSKSNLGAVVSKEHLNSILSKIDIAKKEGGSILCGGVQVSLPGDLSNGYYLSPTVIEGTKSSDTINQEEVFGPVVTIMPFKTEKEAIELCNNTKYGLSASIFTQNISRAHRVSAKLDAGVIWVNSWLVRDLRIPFGGMKSSGVGREGGFSSLEFFTETKNVCIKVEKG